jgi:hypothetical protein
VRARECAHMQFSSGITRVSQTWRKSRQECVTKYYVVVGANVKKPNNVVCVTKGGKMFLLINYASGVEDEGEGKASLYTLLIVSSEQRSGQLISGDVRRPLNMKLYG